MPVAVISVCTRCKGENTDPTNSTICLFCAYEQAIKILTGQKNINYGSGGSGGGSGGGGRR